MSPYPVCPICHDTSEVVNLRKGLLSGRVHGFFWCDYCEVVIRLMDNSAKMYEAHAEIERKRMPE